ncbi:hypothetical protein SEVIR_J004601v4 [Setaria viridis]|uniref:Uncharacterized protein n=2 Tax=Setaria TaxID=4554 RepID=A0A368PER9_SETIT|nr:hypothetical protein SETIT_J011400v2 [Setaria italica]
MSRLDMLEGAKSIGAGAATIALAGAAVGIGNVLSSSIHSVARNHPSFLEIILTIFPSVIPLFIATSVILFSFVIKKAKFQCVSSSLFFVLLKFIPFLQIFIFAFIVFFRLILPVGQVLAHLTCCSSFLISLPPEIQNPQALAHLEGLNFYLSLYEQDPEWVAFIQQELNHNTPLEDIPGRLRLFLMEERTSSLRLDLIQEFISQYARNEAVLPVEPYLLEGALRSYLDFLRSTDNFSILQAAYQDLRENEGGSVFFSESHNRDFLEAQSAKRTWIEAERRWLCQAMEQEKARLERAEFQHAQLIFQWEDRQRDKNIHINDMPLGSANDQA